MLNLQMQQQRSLSIAMTVSFSCLACGNASMAVDLHMICVTGFTDCVYMDLNVTEAEAKAMLPVVSISKQTGLELEAAAQQNATVALWMPDYSSFDFNVVVLWMMAVGTFILAGMWAGSDSSGTEHSYLKSQDASEVVPAVSFHMKHLTTFAEPNTCGHCGAFGQLGYVHMKQQQHQYAVASAPLSHVS